MADWLCIVHTYMQFKLSVGDPAGKLIRDVRYESICIFLINSMSEPITTR